MWEDKKRDWKKEEQKENKNQQLERGDKEKIGRKRRNRRI